jgi:hypothetical protein
MKQKFSTIIEVGLLRKLRLESVKQGKQINELVSEALEYYLRRPKTPAERPGVVASTWDSMPVDRKTLRKLMQEEESLFDS